MEVMLLAASVVMAWIVIIAHIFEIDSLLKRVRNLERKAKSKPTPPAADSD